MVVVNCSISSLSFYSFLLIYTFLSTITTEIIEDNLLEIDAAGGGGNKSQNLFYDDMVRITHKLPAIVPIVVGVFVLDNCGHRVSIYYIYELV